MHEREQRLVHDLRNSAMVVREASLELRERLTAAGHLADPMTARLLDMLGRRSQLALHLLEELARPAAGGPPVQLRAVDLGALVADLVVGRRGRTGSPVLVDVEPGVRLLGDPERVAQVFDNLLVNALRHGGPHVVVRGRTDGDRVELTVSDDGAGVPATLRPVVFEPGVARPESFASGGTGLGLSISRDLCRAMGGTLEYRHGPRPTFAARFPAVPEVRAARRPDAALEGHPVLFWRSDAELVDAVADYATTGLAAGEAVVVAATPRHLSLVDDGLRRAGADPQRLRDTGQYVPLDAERLHHALRDGDRVDPGRFATFVETAVNGIAERWASFRVFGEIVDLYRRADHPALALQLEDCWNDFRRRTDFPLLCGYEEWEGRPADHGVVTCHDRVVA